MGKVTITSTPLEHIAMRYDLVKEGVKSVMGGKILEYEAKTIWKAGIEQGIEGTVSILKKLKSLLRQFFSKFRSNII